MHVQWLNRFHHVYVQRLNRVHTTALHIITHVQRMNRFHITIRVNVHRIKRSIFT